MIILAKSIKNKHTYSLVELKNGDYAFRMGNKIYSLFSRKYIDYDNVMNLFLSFIEE